MANINLQILVVFFAYILIIFVIGIIASRMIHSHADYVLGGRRLSGPIAALGAGASDMSGWLLMALPGAVYVNGLNQIWLPIGLIIGAYINWLFIAKRLRVYTELAGDALTIPAYFANRFHDKSRLLRMVTACVVLVFFTFYAAAGFVAGALLTQSTFGLPYQEALYVSAAVLVAYTCVGGFLAVSWIDFFQGSLMFFALLLVPMVVMQQLGGWTPTWAELHTDMPTHLLPLHDMHGLALVSLLAWGLGYFGQPHILVRFMAVRSASEIPVARRVCMSWMVVSLIGAFGVGLLGSAYYHVTPLHDAETVFLMLARNLFSPWLAGVLLAAVLSAIMSTIAAQLLASASAVCEDFYRAFMRPQAHGRELLLVSRVAVVVIALVAIAIANSHDDSLLKLVSYAWSGIGASFGPIILLSLYWSRLTRNGAAAGMIIGAVTVLVWQMLDRRFGGVFTLYEIVPAFFANGLMAVVVSVLGKSPEQPILDEFKQVEQAL